VIDVLVLCMLQPASKSKAMVNGVCFMIVNIMQPLFDARLKEKGELMQDVVR
jgi:hypothetical protein